MKPSAAVPARHAEATSIDQPLASAARLLGDHWTLRLVLALSEREGLRFSDLAGAPGLSRRVLAERLRLLVAADLLARERYQESPPRYRYRLSERGGQVRRHAMAMVHVAAGGVFAAPASAVGETAVPEHPADRLLQSDLAQARTIFTETIAPVARYDDQYRTEFVRTLEVWLASDASVSLAAAKLHAHRHTVRYRLARVRELTGLDVDATSDRERLQLGLRALAVLRARGFDPRR